jgi:hypothetical protein
METITFKIIISNNIIIITQKTIIKITDSAIINIKKIKKIFKFKINQ